MQNDQREIHIDEDHASAGEKSGHMRWVLGIGTLLAIVALSSIWIFGAATQDDMESEATVSGKAEVIAERNTQVTASEAAKALAEGEALPAESGEPAPAQD